MPLPHSITASPVRASTLARGDAAPPRPALRAVPPPPQRDRPAAEALPAPHWHDRVLRLADIAGALALMIMTLPAIVLIALTIRLTSPGPMLFAQTRIGAGGRRFACLKFRTMVVDADVQLRLLLERDPAARAEWQRSQKLRHDPRVSAVGRILRRTSLDELPQLINVLIGDMSLVGPRPIVEAEIARYGRHFAAYCRVRPGLTGLWQVRRDGDTSYRRRVAYDVAFARSRSPGLYLAILARTVPVVLVGRGAW